MMYQRPSVLLHLFLLFGTISLAQDPASVVRGWLQQQHASLGLTAKDATDWTVTSTSTDKKGVTYVYIEQVAHGLPVRGAVASFAVRSGTVVSFGNRLRADVLGRTTAPAPSLDAVDALRQAVAQLGLPAWDSRVLRSNSITDLVLDGTEPVEQLLAEVLAAVGIP